MGKKKSIKAEKKAAAPASRAAGRAVDPSIPPRSQAVGSPLALPTVYGCARLLQATAAQQEVTAVRGGQPWPLPSWLRRPELGTGQMRLRPMVIYAAASSALAGYAAWWATPMGDGWDLKPLAPRRVDAVFNQNHERVYYLDGQQVDYVFPASTQAWREAGLLIAGYFIDPERPLPLGPLQAARAGVAGWLDVEAYSANIFSSGRGTTGRYMSTEKDLPPETLEAYADVWMEKQADPLARMPALGGGLKIEDSMLDPETAQWLGNREFNAQEACRMYGIPPRYLGLPSGDASTYATARDNDAQLLRFATAPITDGIADAWSSLLPAGRNAEEDVEIKFSAGRMLAPTPLEENQSDQIAIAAGILTADEVRQRRSLGAAPAEKVTANA